MRLRITFLQHTPKNRSTSMLRTLTIRLQITPKPHLMAMKKDQPLFCGNIEPQERTFKSTASTPSFHTRILPTIKHDHQELVYHSQKIFTSTNPDEQTRYQNQFTWELARHLIGEELVVYPAIIASLSDGQEAADRNRMEHQGIKEKLKIFQDLASTDPRFVPTLRGLMDDFGIHARHEEDVELPRLESMLSKDESVEMTKSLDRTKVFVPSRSHPHSPVKPPFESVAGLITAPIDSVADLFRKWPDGKKG
ncbi:unnamed protein product [Penicillium salamii]|nr:unnamed protein product [Penicillium salamii]